MNIAALVVWQGSVYLIPLITTPYLARVLGLEPFGYLAIAGAVVSYISLVSEWGFSLSATQKAAQNASSPEVLRQLFWDVSLARALLATAAIVVAAIVVLLVPGLRAMAPVLLAYLLQVVFSILNAGWLLQGVERMVGFASASLAGRLLTVPLIFLFVRTPDDVVIAAAIQGGTFLISTLASLYAVSRTVSLGPVRPSLSGACREIREGMHIFISTGGVSLYSQANLLVLAAISGAAQAGLYTGADRIKRGVQGVIGPVSMGVFPRVSNLLVHAPHRARRLMTIVAAVQAAVTLALSVLMYVSADMVTQVFLGSDFVGAADIVRMLAPVPFIVGLSNILGINIMLPHGMTRTFMQITLGAGVLNLTLLVPLCLLYGGVGAAAATTITEAMVTLCMAGVVYARRHRLFPTPQGVASPA
ncbi:oligosaccharide flippase family protein [Terrihabitans sp. B22-R8]|uniref:oligosaccharide flippase family protein n=1 Tax=Terrihabitans sp. B22-R8 TaxID=3425128 RepID=UPI00403CAB42